MISFFLDCISSDNKISLSRSLTIHSQVRVQLHTLIWSIYRL